AIDKRAPRDGRALEELGTYDTSISDTDARAVLNKERINYWLSVGAQPSEKVAVLIKKYGDGGTHLEAQRVALEKLALGKEVIDPGDPASQPPDPEEAKKAEEEAKAAAAEPAGEATADSEAAPAEAAEEKAEPATAEAAAQEESKEEKAEEGS
ncbi:MAG: 30S ribosomal protein S16, partial [Planctomycetota bacterium]